MQDMHNTIDFLLSLAEPLKSPPSKRHTTQNFLNSPEIKGKKNSCVVDFHYKGHVKSPPPQKRHTTKNLLGSPEINQKKNSCQINFHYKTPKKQKKNTEKSHSLTEFKTMTYEINEKKTKSFMYNNNNIIEVSFQKSQSENSSANKNESSLEMFDVLKDVEEYSDQVLEKAKNLLAVNNNNDLQTSKTTRITETNRTSVVTDKSSFIDKSPAKSNQKLSGKSSKHMETVKRLYLKHEKTKEKINEIKNQEYEHEKNKYSFHPTISENSRLMLAHNKQKPLFLRTEEIIKRKNDEIEKLKKMKSQQNESFEKQLTFKPEILNQEKRHKDNKQLYEELERWRVRKQEKIEKLNIELIEREFNQLTFHPTVNELSKKLAERRKKKLESKQKKAEEMQKDENKQNIVNTQTTSFNKTKKKLPVLRPKTMKKQEKNKENKENIEKFSYNSKKNMSKNHETSFSLGKKSKDNSLSNSKKSSKSPTVRNDENLEHITSSPSPSKQVNKLKITKKSPSPSPKKPRIKKERQINVVKYEPSLNFLLNILKK